jgi:heme oxygenase
LTARALLRAATRAAHDQVDAAFSHWDLGDHADYTAFLSAQARAFLPVEQALADLGDWSERARGPLLVADLADLGVTAPASEPFAFASPPAMIGGAYVLEGSRLGGAMLRKSVAPGLPTRFLTPSTVAGHWQKFLATLEQELASDVQRTQAVAGAQFVFDLFLRAALAPTG